MYLRPDCREGVVPAFLILRACRPRGQPPSAGPSSSVTIHGLLVPPPREVGGPSLLSGPGPACCAPQMGPRPPEPRPVPVPRGRSPHRNTQGQGAGPSAPHLTPDTRDGARPDTRVPLLSCSLSLLVISFWKLCLGLCSNRSVAILYFVFNFSITGDI